MIENPAEAFSHGFLATSGRHDADEEWASASIGPLSLHLHPTLGREFRTHSSGNEVALLGEPADINQHGLRSDRIAREILSKLENQGFDATIRYVAYLGGRFVCIIYRPGERLIVLPDCHATHSVYWQVHGSHVVLSSHSHLLAEATGADVDEQALDLMRRCKEMGTGGTHYLPGIRTPFDEVYPLLPNHMLSIDVASGDVDHTRFYPGIVSPESIEGDPQRRVEESFSRHARHLCGLGRIGISLTAGVDSRTSLMASAPHMDTGSFTWTWAKFGDADADVVKDVLAANELSFDLGFPHRIVELRRNVSEDDFVASYRRSFGKYPQHPTAAFAMRMQLPAHFYHLLSMLAETGTGFYKRRTEDSFDSRRLSYLYSRFEFGQLSEVIELHEELIDYASFTPSRLANFDYHDLFYWEVRAGRWAAARIQEADLSHRVILPFNQRGIVEALLAIPFEQRANKQPLLAMIDHLSGRLLPRRSGSMPG